MGIALTLRIGVVATRFEELTQDRDLYLGVAENVWNGVGYCSPGTTTPTAFRPPLTVLIYAVVKGLGGTAGLAVYQILASFSIVLLTFEVGRTLRLKYGAWIAAGIVALDPILLRYTVLPMTEITFTLFLWGAIASWCRYRTSHYGWLLSGALLGLSALARPSIWPILLVVPVLVAIFISLPRSSSRSNKQTLDESQLFSWRSKARRLLGVAIVAMVVAMPWGIRNALVMGKFKLTTTHGGYTLLLGNNETFFKAIVHQPLGTTWGDYSPDDPLSQTQWYERLTRQLNEMGLKTEFERDEAQYQMAFDEISKNPVDFIRAILLRELRLWSPIPQGPEAESYPQILMWGLVGFGTVVYALAFMGLVRLCFSSDDLRPWIWPLAVVITISTVHAFYWSNARMRAPMVPAVALLAGRSLLRRSETTKNIRETHET